MRTAQAKPVHPVESALKSKTNHLNMANEVYLQEFFNHLIVF